MLHQGSEWVALDTPITFKEISAPDTPLDGYLKLYAKSTGLFFKGDNGTEVGPLAAAVTTLDHGVLTGLSDDDHTGYALLIGRTTGQTLIGGVNSGANLILRSTSHATRGGIFLGDTPSSLSSIHPTLTADYHQFFKNSTSSGPDVQIVGMATADTSSLGALAWGTKGASASDKRTALIHAALVGSGATNPAGRLEFYTRISGGATFNQMTYNAVGRLGLGGVTLPTGAIEVRGSGADGQYYCNRVDSVAAGPGLIGKKARGTVGSEAVPVADDQLLQLVGQGWQNSAYHTQANIKALSGETWSGTNRGTYITFETTPLASTTIAERFRIGPSGQLGIGGATYGSDGSYFRSAGASAAPVWSTLILPNAATANRLVYASSSNTYGESADLTYDGTDLGIGSGKRFRMQSQNRIRFLNSMANVYRITSDQTLSNNTNTIVEFNAEQFDTDTIHDNSTNPGRLTARLAGKYVVSCSIRWEGNATGTRSVGLRKNGTTFISANGSKDVEGNHVIVTGSPVIIDLAANDYVEVIAFQDSGGDLDIIVDTRTTISMAYVGE